MNRIPRLLVRLGACGSDGETNRGDDPRVDLNDAEAAAHSRHGNPAERGGEGGGLPPNYVKSYGAGRPRK
jgi:hypothetical protein